MFYAHIPYLIIRSNLHSNNEDVMALLLAPFLRNLLDPRGGQGKVVTNGFITFEIRDPYTK